MMFCSSVTPLITSTKRAWVTGWRASCTVGCRNWTKPVTVWFQHHYYQSTKPSARVVFIMPVPFGDNIGRGPPTICPPLPTVCLHGFLGPLKVGEEVWVVRSLFPLGSNQQDGLTYAGLRDRLLSLLGDKPITHPALNFAENESSFAELSEEVAKVQDIVADRPISFPLDITMTVIRHGGKLALHSAVPPSQELLAEIAKLGEVSWLLAPNLQHWLFLPAWLAAFPSASVGLAPPALGESLTSKMPHLADHKGAVGLLGQPEVMAKLEEEMGLIGRHLQGAPLNLNEYLFYHDTSGTMIASDSFYGGYAAEETPSWFARLWFKLTRRGSFRTARLPIYR